MAESTQPIGVGIIGLGRAGWGMQSHELKSRSDKFRIVAGCDLEADFRKRLADACNCNVYKKIGSLLSDPAVELVSVASRTTEHVAHALMGLAAGKYVFLEKPIAVSYPEAMKLARAARRAPGRLFIRHNRRFEQAFNEIKRIVESGILGEVYNIKLRRHSYSRRDDWQTLKQCGGGQLLNWGPHIIDHALQFLDYSVEETWSDLKRIAAVGDAEDHVRIVMKGKGGCVVDIEISGGAALPEPEYTVHGSKGALVCTGNKIKMRHLDPAQKLPARKAKKGTPKEGGFGSPDALSWVEKELEAGGPPADVIWDHLYGAIRLGQKFPITLEQALAVMKTISAAKRGTEF